ncbi:hypothetical protein DZF96_00110 [Clavibacter michiganensis]|uniref:Uncharacterized protein n=1 Tax=Clavibacter michiganensis TaxID=28447 RepID=A0A399NZ55_9MICO|nr:hypothetical protein DZF96_00110 [Clavibacter michiganensis]
MLALVKCLQYAITALTIVRSHRFHVQIRNLHNACIQLAEATLRQQDEVLEVGYRPVRPRWQSVATTFDGLDCHSPSVPTATDVRAIER